MRPYTNGWTVTWSPSKQHLRNTRDFCCSVTDGYAQVHSTSPLLSRSEINKWHNCAVLESFIWHKHNQCNNYFRITYQAAQLVQWLDAWMIEEQWFDLWQGQGIISLLQSVQTSSGTHPASDSMCTWVSLPRSKVAVGEADHTPPSSAEIKNEWSYTSTPSYDFMVHTGKTLWFNL
jgi:hypothetical protein